MVHARLLVVLMGLASVGVGAKNAGSNSGVVVTHYSDAQCPCSARVPQDVKEAFLDNAGFSG